MSGARSLEPDARDGSSAYRVPTRAVPVSLDLGRGPSAEVEMYLSTISETRSGAETLGEALNGTRSFLPVRERRGERRHYLVRRRAIRVARVRLAGSLEVDSAPGPEGAGRVDRVRLELSGGGTLSGTLVTSMPPSRARLSDFFNASDMIFLPLFVEEEIFYVNKGRIVSVRW